MRSKEAYTDAKKCLLYIYFLTKHSFYWFKAESVVVFQLLSRGGSILILQLKKNTPIIFKSAAVKILLKLWMFYKQNVFKCKTQYRQMVKNTLFPSELRWRREQVEVKYSYLFSSWSAVQFLNKGIWVAFYHWRVDYTGTGYTAILFHECTITIKMKVL